jgi:hypothetical protein
MPSKPASNEPSSARVDPFAPPTLTRRSVALRAPHPAREARAHATSIAPLSSRRREREHVSTIDFPASNRSTSVATASLQENFALALVTERDGINRLLAFGVCPPPATSETNDKVAMSRRGARSQPGPFRCRPRWSGLGMELEARLPQAKEGPR